MTDGDASSRGGEGHAEPRGSAGRPAHARERGLRRTDRLRQWPAYVFALLFATGVALVVLRLGDRFGPADASASVRSYRIVEGTGVEVTVSVRRDPARDALCLLRSRDQTGAQVGHFDLRIPADPAGQDEVVATGTVPTTARAVTGEAGACLSLEPGAPPPFEDHAPDDPSEPVPSTLVPLRPERLTAPPSPSGP